MAQLTCDLCGGTDLVKEGGLFVCKNCGAKYTVEEARAMLANAEAAKPQMSQGPRIGAGGLGVGARPVKGESHASAAGFGSVKAEAKAGPELRVDSAAGFDSVGINVGMAGARSVNNYVCRGWQMLVDEYKKLENPDKARLEKLAARAKECLMLLDNAAMLDPNDHAQNLLIYDNCLEIIESVKDQHYYEKDDEGKMRRRSYPSPFDRFEIPGQRESWSDKRKFHEEFLVNDWNAVNYDLIERIEQLEQQAQGLRAQLDVLEQERKSKGFFNFSEKREVKDRMAPYEEELSQINSQIRSIERERENAIEGVLRELGSGYTRLKF
ncbi:MAG: hypothetical protein IJH87_02160 [Atopobiaceae bacterium]|nr:hypothetical protein [Atopobiaceae bacterium]